MDVLLIAFGRFPGAPFNPTPRLVRALARRRRPAAAGLRAHVHVLTVSYGGVEREVPRLIARYRPEVVLMLGLAARSREVRIETRARNALSHVFPDAEGRRAARAVIEREGPSARVGRAPARRIVRALRASRIPARLSRDAGRYICNLAYWQALAAPEAACVQFVHVPTLSRDPRPRRSRGRRPLTAADLVNAAEIILMELAACVRARRTTARSF